MIWCGNQTNSMQQSPSWGVKRSSACQEIPRILRNPKVDFHIHKRLPTVPVLRQINPEHSFPSHFLKIHCNVIFPSRLRSSKYSSFESVYQNPVCTSPVTHMFHISRASDFFYDLITRIFGKVYRAQRSSLFIRSLHSVVTSSHLSPNSFFSSLLSSNLRVCSSFTVSDQASHPHKTTG